MTIKSMSKWAALAGLTLLLAACGGGNTATSDSSSATSGSQTQTTESSVDLNALDLPQLDKEVKDNESVVEMKTSEGNIKIKLFPEIAPKAVENFMTHAKDKYYDGVTFHRVVEDFMIQSGDPKGDGTGGESIWGEPFEMEISKQLYHLRGALSMARSQDPVSQGSQFFIVQNHDDVSDGRLDTEYPQKIIDAYKDGGVPQLDSQYTVFGQVIEGMDVVDKIAAGKVEASSSGEMSKPVDPVKIETIEIIQEAK